ncbi:TetR/AcrR family transcriptional regulator [Jiulongibacter sp. NS-SX5]|uniref:TetR/AcrR family transcriptional regulator n=1 Tax=Jiulongibacter sp. NS-SX5 TaxID=3463854 RepID=UPI0040587BA7
MPIVKTNKEEIIEIALQVFRENGYYNTSMSDLAKACGLQKGSFYHYFASKEKMMSAVLLKVKSELEDHVFSNINLSTENAREQLQKILLGVGENLLQKKGGCIIANTTLETNGQEVEFRKTLKEIILAWQEALKSVFVSQFSEGTSLRLAQQTIMEFEGAVMYSELFENDQYLKDVYVRTLAKLK